MPSPETIQGGAGAPIVRAPISEDVNRQRKQEMVKDLKEKVFPDRTISFVGIKDGKKEVRSK